MQAYHRTLLQKNQYSARLFHAVLRSLGARKKCTNPVHSRDSAVHSFFERNIRIQKIWGKIARYLPISRDICPFCPSSADLGWYSYTIDAWDKNGNFARTVFNQTAVSAEKCIELAQNKPIFDGKSFWKAESEMEWVEW